MIWFLSIMQSSSPVSSQSDIFGADFRALTIFDAG